MLIAIAVALMLAMAAYDIPVIVQLKEWGELCLYAALWVAALTLSILQILDLHVITPTTVITKLMTPLGEALLRALGAL